MFAEVDVFISNYTLVDPEVYQLWVDGCSSSEAISALHQHGITQQTGATLELVASDVLDHYRTYSLLERLLHNPPKLAEQLAFQIEPETRQVLIEKYYEFDGAVIRELLGKKLSSRHRKDLDEVSEKTGVSLKSCRFWCWWLQTCAGCSIRAEAFGACLALWCWDLQRSPAKSCMYCHHHRIQRRQFDNVKRVFKTVEEMQGSVVQNIKNNFLLPDELAKRYGAVVFIACMRFETSKRKLQHLTFADFYHCALEIMANWTYAEGSPDFDDTDLDREFLLDLRELRLLLDKEKEHKHLVCIRLKPALLERSYQELEVNFRTYSRALIGLACNLHRSRELRCLFLELVERCLEPWRQVSWSQTDLRHFLSAYSQCAMEMDVFREADVKSAWERYMTVVSACLTRMYHP